jgi:hypothetical protein
MLPVGEGISSRALAEIYELNLCVSVLQFEPGALFQAVWGDPTRPMNTETYFRSHVPLSCPFVITMKFADGSDDVVEIPQGAAWPHKEIRAGFRQVFCQPKISNQPAENFCVIPINVEKYSLAFESIELKKDEILDIETDRLLLVFGTNYLISGNQKSQWSITVCLQERAQVYAVEDCRILIYRAVPLTPFEKGLA